MYVCICRAKTEADIRRLGRLGVTSPEDLIAVLGLAEDDCCGQCVRNIDRLSAIAREGRATERRRRVRTSLPSASSA